MNVVHVHSQDLPTTMRTQEPLSLATLFAFALAYTTAKTRTAAAAATVGTSTRFISPSLSTNWRVLWLVACAVYSLTLTSVPTQRASRGSAALRRIKGGAAPAEPAATRAGPGESPATAAGECASRTPASSPPPDAAFSPLQRHDTGGSCGVLAAGLEPGVE